jgi:hypothetical protein
VSTAVAEVLAVLAAPLDAARAAVVRRWLVEDLSAHVREVANDPHLDVQTFAEWRGRRYYNAGEAEDMLDDLPAVQLARAACTACGDDAASLAARDAIELIAGAIALEHSIARELDQDAADALYPAGPDPEFAARADRAERAFEQFAELLPSLEQRCRELLSKLR